MSSMKLIFWIVLGLYSVVHIQNEGDSILLRVYKNSFVIHSACNFILLVYGHTCIDIVD